MEALAETLVGVASVASLALPAASVLRLSSSYWALVAVLLALVLAQPALPQFSSALSDLHQAWMSIKGELLALAIGVLLNQQKASALLTKLALVCCLWGAAYRAQGYDLLQTAVELASLALGSALVLAIKLWSVRHLAKAMEQQQRALMKHQEAAHEQRGQHDGQHPLPWDSTKLADQEPDGLAALSNSSSSADSQDSILITGPSSFLTIQHQDVTGTADESALLQQCQPAAPDPHGAQAGGSAAGSGPGWEPRGHEGDDDEDEDDMYAQYRSPLGQTTRVSIKINTGHTLRDLPPDTARRLNVLLHTINQSRSSAGASGTPPVMLTRLAVREGCIFLSLGVQTSTLSDAHSRGPCDPTPLLQHSLRSLTAGSSRPCRDQHVHHSCQPPALVQEQHSTPNQVCGREDELEIALQAAAGVLSCLDLMPSQLGSNDQCVWVQAGGSYAEAGWDAGAAKWRAQGGHLEQLGVPAATGVSSPPATLASAKAPVFLLPASWPHLMSQQQCITASQGACDGAGQMAVLRWRVRMCVPAGVSVAGAPLLPPGHHDVATDIPTFARSTGASTTAGTGQVLAAGQPCLRAMVIANGQYLDTRVVSVSGPEDFEASSTGHPPAAVGMVKLDAVLEAQVPLALWQPPCLEPGALSPHTSRCTAAPLLSLTLELRQGAVLLDWLPAVVLLKHPHNVKDTTQSQAAEGAASPPQVLGHKPAQATVLVGASASAAQGSPVASARTQFVTDLATCLTLLHACQHVRPEHPQLRQLPVSRRMACNWMATSSGGSSAVQGHMDPQEWALLAHLPHLCSSLLQYTQGRRGDTCSLSAVAQELLRLLGVPAVQ